MEQKKTDTHKYLCDYANDLRKKGLPNDEIFHNLLVDSRNHHEQDRKADYESLRKRRRR